MENPQIDEISILKTIWRKNEVGVWTINGIKGIDLKPQEGFANDYFKIKNELNFMTQNPSSITNNLFTAFGTTEFLVRQSIVPIVALNDGDEEIRCIGTGFFISASGLLITAAHVLRDPIDENYSKVTQIENNLYKLSDNLRFGIMLPPNPAIINAPPGMDPIMREAKWFMCPFEWTRHWGKDVKSPLLHKKPEFKLDLDVAVCKVSEQSLIGPYQPLNIGLHNLKLGDRAVAIGYPHMKNIRLGGDDYQPELVVSVGSVIAIHPDNMTNKKNSTPGPNFEFNAKIPGKMSGSPILVGGGTITKGVVSRSLGSGENHASGCLIASILNLPLIDNKSILGLMKDGEEGISQVIGADL